jgi:hypothetical protein
MLGSYLRQAKASLLVTAVALLCLMGLTSGASASSDLYDFCCYSDQPYLSVVDPTPAAAGTLYGVASQIDFGSVGYAFALVKSGSTYAYKTMYRFCSESDCTDGFNPVGRLIVDTSGNLYGVTQSGGLSNSQPYGTVYELIPNADHSQWTHATLYEFCQRAACADGLTPPSGLTYAGATTGQLYDGKSPLYGVAAGNGHGLVYRLTRKKNVWSEKVIHQFCRKSGCPDGDGPTEIVADASGNLIGIAGGGKGHGGIVFRLDAANAYREQVLYSFCHKPSCSDGSIPVDIGLDSSGQIYGVTDQGGSGNAGVFFTIAAGSYKAYTNLGTDGIEPNTVLVTPDGKVFGTTRVGLLFSYDSSGIHTLSDPCCSGGVQPFGLAYGGGSALFGTTEFGGASGAGLIYEQDLP